MVGHPIAPVVPSSGQVSPVGLDEVELIGGFWGGRQAVNASATLEHCVGWLERVGWLGNFDRTAAGDFTGCEGREFADSETYKVLEALAWEFGRSRDEAVDRLFRTIAARVVSSQDPDGYLNTRFGHLGQPERWSDLQWGHELYCAGHLLQAAVARYRTVGEDEFVRAASAVADNIIETFGPEDRQEICGHPEVEVALAEFGRALGRPEYVDQARLFVERRGHGVLGDNDFGSEYYQDDLPVREARVLRGHAVRALYLAAGAVDVAVETGDGELLAALVAQWEQTVATRTYLTGGMGSRHAGEAFGLDHELPSDRAYCETCAGVAAVMFSWRLYLATGQLRFADLIERVLYNVIATSPSADGRSFFYTNPLHQRTVGSPVAHDEVNPRATSSQRAPWFAVSCCPTNLARTFASLGCYCCAWRGTHLDLLQYGTGQIATTGPDGARLVLRVTTDYPVSGRVEIEVVEATGDAGLRLRVPSWSARTSASVDARSLAVSGDAVVVDRVRAGSTIVLELQVEPRWTFPSPRIDAVRGCVAIESGPVVMALESVALPEGLDLHAVAVDTTRAPAPDGDGVRVGLVRSAEPVASWPYGRPSGHDDERLDVTVRPYHQWGESGPTQMRVWIPVWGADHPTNENHNEGEEAF